MHANMHKYKHTLIHAYTFTLKYTQACMNCVQYDCECTCVRVSVCARVTFDYVRVHAHAFVCIYVCVYDGVRVSMCVYVCACVFDCNNNNNNNNKTHYSHDVKRNEDKIVLMDVHIPVNTFKMI